MARPKTKKELLALSDENYKKLFELFDSMSVVEQNKNFVFEDRDKNIRDIFVHLHEWHQLLLNWVKLNREGVESHFLPEPYNWKTYPEMNIEFWKKHQNTSLEQAKILLESSHLWVMKLVKFFTDEELFTKKHFSWTGTTSLGSYCVSATSSHYDWAIKKMRKHKRSLK